MNYSHCERQINVFGDDKGYPFGFLIPELLETTEANIGKLLCYPGYLSFVDCYWLLVEIL